MKKLLGAMAAVAVLGLGALANAEGTSSSQSSDIERDTSSGVGGSGSSYGTGSTGSTGTMGGSGQTGQMGSESMGQNQLEGRVLKADKSSIMIEHMGAAVPFTVSRDTTFQGGNIKSARDIKEGQQVRASFEMKNNKNQLKSVEVLESGMGTGGTGLESDPSKSKSKSDSDLNQPTNPNQGGSSY